MDLDGTTFLALVGVRPDRYGLLLWLQEHLTDEEIEWVAEADSGFHLEDNRKALRKILNAGELRGLIGVRLPSLHEACQLTMFGSWHGEDDLDEHRSVVFACTVLILAGAPGEAFDGWMPFPPDLVATLVRSSRHLGAKASGLALAMLADGLQRYPDFPEEDRLFFGLGLAALAPTVPDRAFELLLELEEALHAQDVGPGDTTWLWRTTFFDQAKHIWRQELLAAAARGPASPSRTKMAEHIRTWPIAKP